MGELTHLSPLRAVGLAALVAAIKLSLTGDLEALEPPLRGCVPGVVVVDDGEGLAAPGASAPWTDRKPAYR